MPCHVSCLTCNGPLSSDCIVCDGASDYFEYIPSTGRQCLDDYCPVGMYPDVTDKTCKVCIVDKCLECSDSSTCTKCEEDFFID